MSFEVDFRIFRFSQKIQKVNIFGHFCVTQSGSIGTKEATCPFQRRSCRIILVPKKWFNWHHFDSGNISKSELFRNHHSHCTDTLVSKYLQNDHKLNHFWREHFQLFPTFPPTFLRNVVSAEINLYYLWKFTSDWDRSIWFHILLFLENKN